LKALLDTHTILYIAADPGRLGKRARKLIDDPAAILNASLTSLWEICIKEKLGKLALSVDPGEFWTQTMERARIVELPIERAAILKTSELDLSHRDPFDRLLAAQALVAGIAFISEDASVDAWGVERIW
jgi:PIN domain nuclease of toxin-antitoxin system